MKSVFGFELGVMGTFTSSGEVSTITLEDIEKARKIIEAIPKPIIDRINITVNEYMPPNTVMISKDVYEKYQEFKEKNENKTNAR